MLKQDPETGVWVPSGAAPIAAQLDQQEQPKSEFLSHPAASGKWVEGCRAWNTSVWNPDQAAQLDAELPPPDALVKRSEWDDAKAKRQSFNGWRVNYGDCDMPLFTESTVRNFVAPYAERIRNIEAAYAAAMSLASDTIDARNAEVAEQAERIRLLERELEAARQVGKHLFTAVAESSAQQPAQSIDTPEFVKLEAAYVKALYEYPDAPSMKRADALVAARRALIAYIDGRTAGTAPEGWREFIEFCATTAGKEVDGNGLAFRAKQLIAAAPSPQENTN